jgi:hypothetical protein
MTELSFKERLERLERVQGASRVTSGSSADVQLQPPQNLRDLRTISAVETLVRRGVRVPLAKAVVEDLVHQPSQPVSVHVPKMEGRQEFASEMAANGVHVIFLAPDGTMPAGSGG